MRIFCRPLIESMTVLALAGFLSCASASRSSVEVLTTRPDDSEFHRPIKGWQKISETPVEGAANIQCVSDKACWIFMARQLWRSLNGGLNWELMFSGSESEGPYQFHFITESRGWRFSSGEISRTEDGGRNWVEQTSPISAPQGQVRFLLFKNGNEGWLTGGLYRPLTKEEQTIGVPNNLKDPTGEKVLEETIYRTVDGGVNWQREKLSPKSSGRIVRVTILGEAQAVALAEHSFYYFDDQRGSWNHAMFNPACVMKKYSDDDYGARPVCASISDRLVISLSDGRLVQSKDGGRTWCDLMQAGDVDLGEARGYFVDLHFDGPQHGWALGGNLRLYETNDGGRSWKPISSELHVDSMFFGKNFGFLLSKAGIYRILL